MLMGKKETKKPVEPKPETAPKLIAKKHFVICCNDYFREIKPGEDISDVPARFYPNLKTEGVL